MTLFRTAKSIAAHCGDSSRMAWITEAANWAALPRSFSRPEVVSDSSSLRVFEKSRMSRYAARSTRPTARTGRLASAIAVAIRRSEEHTSELQSLMRISYAVFCLKKKKKIKKHKILQVTIYTISQQEITHYPTNHTILNHNEYKK